MGIALSASARDRVVEEYAYLCSRGARKFVRGGVERADLEQVAAIGLLKAYDRYDPRTQTPFEAFAWLFVVGELMHYVRDYERLVRAPRQLRALERRWHGIYESMTMELQREPSTLEVAQRLGVTTRDVDAVAAYRAGAVAESLDHRAHGAAAGTYTIDRRDDLMVLENALSRLTKLERTIVLALYGRGCSQIEIAARLGYSTRHVSRLHRSALTKMQSAWVQAPVAAGTRAHGEVRQHASGG